MHFMLWSSTLSSYTIHRWLNSRCTENNYYNFLACFFTSCESLEAFLATCSTVFLQLMILKLCLNMSISRSLLYCSFSIEAILEFRPAMISSLAFISLFSSSTIIMSSSALQYSPFPAANVITQLYWISYEQTKSMIFHASKIASEHLTLDLVNHTYFQISRNILVPNERQWKNLLYITFGLLWEQRNVPSDE